MAEYVGSDRFGEAHLFTELLTDLSNAGQMHGESRLLTGKQPVLRLAPAPVDAE